MDKAHPSSADFFQVAYVAADFDRGIGQLQALHSLGPFKQTRNLHMPTRPGHEAIGHFGLAFKGHVQFEVITPTGGDCDIYRDALAEGQPTLRFHHVGRYFSRRDDYERQLEAYAAQWQMPIRCDAFGGSFAYADARQALGHYLEIFTFPTDFFADVPSY